MDPTRRTGVHGPALHVLVVDDDLDVRDVVSFQIRLLGHVAVEADSVAGARRVLAEGGVDVVLTDLDLAGEDGEQVVRAATTAGLPAVRMTGAAASGHSGEDDVVASVLRKPVELEELAAVLTAAQR